MTSGSKKPNNNRNCTRDMGKSSPGKARPRVQERMSLPPYEFFSNWVVLSDKETATVSKAFYHEKQSP